MSVHKLSILVEALGTAEVNSKLKGVDRTVSSVGAHAGQGLRTAAGNLKAIGMGLAATAGVAAVTSLTGALEKGISKVETFGEAVDKTASITGLSIQTASALASALSYVGVDAESTVKMLGMAEKNLGGLTATTKKASDFQKTYGLSLTDSNGKVIDANELLLRSADYFTNKSIPAQTKAAAMAKIYGKNWQSMVEILEMGRPKIQATEADMARLGLTMTPANMASWERFRDATREAGAAVGGLELQLGLLVMPDVTTALKTFTGYLSTHQQDVQGFFRKGLKAAEDIASFITGTLVPVLSSVAGIASKVWGSIPPDFQKLLVGGFVVNKLSGGAVTDILGDVGKQLLKSTLGINAGVVNVKGNVVNAPGGPGSQQPGSQQPGGGSFLSVLGWGALAAQVGNSVIHGLGDVGKSIGDAIGGKAGAGVGAGSQAGAQASSAFFFPGLDTLNDILSGKNPLDRKPMWQQLQSAGGGVVGERMLGGTGSMVREGFDIRALGAIAQSSANRIVGALHEIRLGQFSSSKDLLAGIRARSAKEHGGRALGQSAIDATFTRDIIHKVDVIGKSGYTAEAKLAALQQLAKTADGHSTAGSAAVRAAIRQTTAAVRAQRPPQVYVNVSTAVTASGIVKITSYSNRFGAAGGSWAGKKIPL